MFQADLATGQDRKDLMNLYNLQKGRPFCFWGKDYPAPDNVEEDLACHALFVIRDHSGRPAAAVSIERDEAVDRLSCWDPQLSPTSEIARLAVHPDFQNQGLARRIVAHVMQVLKERGCKSIHLLVNARNIPAIHVYRFFRFETVGECEMYEQHFLCMEKSLEHIVMHPFPPLYDEHSRILILGSFPSVKSRENRFFYGHPQNRFWRTVASVFEEKLPETIPEKKRLILDRQLALWDSISFCEIAGSADAGIRSAIPNDLSIILEHAHIGHIYCNGRKSYEIYTRLIEPRTGRKAGCLPSTSPANAQWTTERLTEAWSVLKDC